MRSFIVVRSVLIVLQHYNIVVC